LLSLTALVLALLSISGHENQIDEAEKALEQERNRQILPDGGHVGRNPGVLVELILDLLPLTQCLVARGRPVPPQLASSTQRLLSMLRYMRLGDGMLARFNGTSVASPAGLATVLAYDNAPEASLPQANASNYARLERGKAILLMDVGPPPPLEAAGQAHAGCL